MKFEHSEISISRLSELLLTKFYVVIKFLRVRMKVGQTMERSDGTD